MMTIAMMIIITTTTTLTMLETLWKLLLTTNAKVLNTYTVMRARKSTKANLRHCVGIQGIQPIGDNGQVTEVVVGIRLIVFFVVRSYYGSVQ